MTLKRTKEQKKKEERKKKKEEKQEYTKRKKKQRKDDEDKSIKDLLAKYLNKYYELYKLQQGIKINDISKFC